MRITTSYFFKELKNILFDWCKQNGCWLSFCNLESERIFRAGWIQCIHPQYHNRDKVRELITRNYPELKDQICVYARTIYVTNADKSRTYTEALAIDGTFEHKVAILKMLCRSNLTSEYPQARYLPFKTGLELTFADQDRAMNYHNEYLKTTYTKVFDAKEPSKLLAVQSTNGIQMSFIQWMDRFRNGNVRLFSKIEELPNNKIRLIYPQKHEAYVAEVMVQMFYFAAEKFGRSVTETMLGPETKFQEKAESLGVERAYAASTAKFIRNLPVQKNPAPPQRTNRLTYGKAPVQTKSFAQAASTNVVHNIPDSQPEQQAEETQDDLRNMVTKLQNQQSQMEGRMKELMSKEGVNNTINVQSHISQEVTKINTKVQEDMQQLKGEMENKIQESETKVMKTITENKKKTDQQFENITNMIQRNQEVAEERAAARAKHQNDMSARILAQLMGSTITPEMPQLKSPSVVEPSSHRGGIR